MYMIHWRLTRGFHRLTRYCGSSLAMSPKMNQEALGKGSANHRLLKALQSRKKQFSLWIWFLSFYKASQIVRVGEIRTLWGFLHLLHYLILFFVFCFFLCVTWYCYFEISMGKPSLRPFEHLKLTSILNREKKSVSVQISALASARIG